MTTSTSIATIEQWIGPVQQDFTANLSDDAKINLASEAGFAVQVIQSNSFAMGVAQKNPASLRNAVMNIAAIGISLNPAEKLAYLVPRGGAICLDISYRGLAQIAVDSGAADWVDARIVYANDDYQPRGIGELPEHRPANPFAGNRGAIVGVYAAAKRKDGTYAVKELPIDRINAIKARSESAKRGSGPWKTDEEEMILKTAVKSVVKMLQGTNKRIDAAVAMLNQQGEGIDFESERKQGVRDVNASAEAQQRISELLTQNAVDWESLVAAGHVEAIVGRSVREVADMSMLEAGKVIAMLEMRLNRTKRSQ